ncbi:MAG TPA: RagB/SusD family nutrient uptake outer membrane protein, partial [Bacteroidales bacterium]|nr:RagB/SusD family nutrient uptake outer membrane protein [Bacteroidales bacterium]
MKNTINYTKKFRGLVIVPVLLLTMMISSCKDIIETDPYSSVAASTAFSTPSMCELSVMGMYSAAQLGYYAASYRGYPFGAAFVEQGDNHGEDVVNNASFYQITYTGTYTTSSANNYYYWSDTYRLINSANIVYEGAQAALDNGVLTAEVAHQYMGEALAFRAISHLELLFFFAYPYKHTADASHWGVPYRNIANTSAEAIATSLAQGRNSVADCYSKILADLNQAETWLPAKADADYPVTRFTKEACAALKTRVYMHMWDWTNLLTEAKKFEAGGVYATSGVALEATPGGAFDQLGYSKKENVFSIENSETTNPGVNAALASMYNNRLLVCISPIVWRNSFWLANDKRREEGNMVFTSSGVKYTLKYKDTETRTDGAPVIRYAEVLLNEAEAYARQAIANSEATCNANALAALNKVRDRALADPATQSYTTTSIDAAATAAGLASNVYLLKAILAERRIEFVCEGRRWADIHRLQFDNQAATKISGIPGKVSNGGASAALYTLGTELTGTKYASPYPVGGDVTTYVGGYKFLWPIPADEINNNPT